MGTVAAAGQHRQPGRPDPLPGAQRPGPEHLLAHRGGDNPQQAREAVAAAKGRADIIITTGGWAPPVMT
ncbi:MAG: hypothetical protein ACLRWQ_16385 [Flavonifractor plautii]